jgi:asparagine N-glycosylation enzyme membrane subunit Stt3
MTNKIHQIITGNNRTMKKTIFLFLAVMPTAAFASDTAWFFFNHLGILSIVISFGIAIASSAMKRISIVMLIIFTILIVVGAFPSFVLINYYGLSFIFTAYPIVLFGVLLMFFASISFSIYRFIARKASTANQVKDNIFATTEKTFDSALSKAREHLSKPEEFIEYANRFGYSNREITEKMESGELDYIKVDKYIFVSSKPVKFD